MKNGVEAGAIYYFQRESQYMSGRGAERGGERESQAGPGAGSTEPNNGLKSTNCEIMTWAEIKSWVLNWLIHPGTPEYSLLKEGWHEAGWEFTVEETQALISYMLLTSHINLNQWLWWA